MTQQDTNQPGEHGQTGFSHDPSRSRSDAGGRLEQERLDLVMKTTDVGLWEWRIGPDELYWDDRAIELFGFTPDAGMYEFLASVHPEDREKVEQTIKHTLETGEEYHIHFRVIQDDKIRRINLHGKYVTGEAEESDYMIGSVQDITDEWASSKTHRTGKEKYELMFESVQDPMFFVDVERSDPSLTFRYIQFNREIEKKAGITSGEMAGCTPDELFDPETAEKLKQNYSRCVEKRETIRYTEQLDMPEGSGTWKTKLTPLIDDGRVEGILGTTRDVGEEMFRKRELKMFRKAIQKNPDEIYIVDPETGVFLDFTESAPEKLGYSREELMTMNVSDVSQEIGKERSWEEYKASMENNTYPVMIETSHLRKDGSSFPVEVRINKVLLQNESDVLVAVARDITERKELEQERTRFKRAVDASGHGVLMTDLEGRITYANGAMENMTGYEANDLKGMTPHVLHSGMHEESFWKTLWQTITSGEIWQGEVVNETKSGELFTVYQTIAPVRDEQEEICAYIAIQEDITEQKEQQEKLMIKSRAIEHSPIGIVMTDATREDNPIYYVNKGFQWMTGYEEEEILGRNCRFLQGEDTDPEVVEEIRRAVTDEEPISREIRNYRADGTMFWNQLIITPVRNEEGKVIRFIGYQLDVTEEKELAKSLQESEARYREMAENIHEVFWMHDVGSEEVLYVSPAVEEIWGQPPEAFYEEAELWLNMIHPDDREEVRSLFTEAADEEYDCEYRVQQPDGTIRWIHDHGYPVRDEEGNTVRIVGAARDITDRKQYKQESQMKSTFVSRVTHDLRTPLNSINGMGNLLMNTEITAEQQEYLRTIVNAAHNMERLTNDILDLDRIERGELSLNTQQFSLSHLLGEVISLYSEEIQERDNMITTEVETEVPEHLIGDPERLRQILHNLVDNAVRHTRDGTIKIMVGVQSQTDTSMMLEITVSDTGEGIPEQQQQAIFQQHNQARKQEAADSDHGLGLGLSICQELVEMMGGDIFVDSEEGVGTDFTFTIQVEEGEESSVVDLEGVHVLLVDDNAVVRKVCRTYLEEYDITVTECDSGEEAWQHIQASEKSKYDVLFIDHRMGALSGVDVVKNIVNSEVQVNLEQVFILSGSPREEVQEALGSISLAGILEKPISESEILKSIRLVVGSAERAESKFPDELITDIQRIHPEPVLTIVVEDNAQSRKLLQEYLEPLAREIRFAHDGREGVTKRFEDPGPDLMLMDFELPEMNGIEAIKEIRREEATRDLNSVPIIAQTAMAMSHVEREFMEAGADRFLRKPIDRAKLYRAIRDVFQAKIDRESS